MELGDFGRLGLALGLGLLVGLQRERSAPHLVGIRTMTLVTVLGSLCALLPAPFGAAMVTIAGVGLVAALIAGYLVRKQDHDDPGLTTLVATLAMYGVGVAIGLGVVQVGILVAGGIALLLHWKRPLHSFVDRIDEKTFHAIFRMVLIGLVVLPLLPDRGFGPYGVLNPFEIWLMVVLVCGMSLGGVVAAQFVGHRGGAVLAGVLGGVVSSTATTMSQARRTRGDADQSGPAALIVTIASTVVFARVAIEIGAVAPSLAGGMLPPLAAVAAIMTAISTVACLRWTGGKKGDEKLPDDRMAFRAALGFALLYSLVLLGVAFARDQLGGGSLYVVAFVSGLADIDAITLSTARLAVDGELEVDSAWRMILVAAMSNLLFKAGIVAVVGHRSALRRVATTFAGSLVAGVLVLLLWP